MTHQGNKLYMPPDVFTIGQFIQHTSVAIFDYDWTLVKPKSGFIHPQSKNGVEWLNDRVVPTLTELHNRGYALIVLTNQFHPWAKRQIRQVLQLTSLPFRVGIATKQSDKKPNRTLFDSTVKWRWNRKESFYVGDALGRPGDWAASDRDFAWKVGIVVRSPDDVFSDQYPLLAISARPLHAPREVVVMVGYPGSGKTTLVRNLFVPNGYIVVSGSNPIDKAVTALASTKSIVVDATNPSSEQRERYIRLAKLKKIPARCIYFAVKRAQAVKQNKQREDPVPPVVYNVYDQNFDIPSLSEGFSHLDVVVRATVGTLQSKPAVKLIE